MQNQSDMTPDLPPVLPGKNAILSECGMDDWLVIENYTGTGQPEGSYEEWRAILDAMKKREGESFRRIGLRFDPDWNAWFCSPRNSMDSYSASVRSGDVDRWIEDAEKRFFPIARANGIADPAPTPKWNWMADWCKKKGISPFDSKNWDRAGEEWDKVNGIGGEVEQGTIDGFNAASPQVAAFLSDLSESPKPDEGEIDEAKWINWTIRKRDSSGDEHSTRYVSKIGPCTRLHVLKSPSVKEWLGSDVYLGIGPSRLEEPTPPKPEDQACDLPPSGWYCTREAGHTGPCAAVELSSKTPRTDAALIPVHGVATDYVDADFARQLESDLAAAKSTITSLRAALESAIKLIRSHYSWEPIEAEDRTDGDGKPYEGPRRDMPAGYVEISNAAGVLPEEMEQELAVIEAALAPAISGKGEG